MPQDVDALISRLFDGLFDRLAGPAPARGERSFMRLAGGVVALDLGDEDHVFQIRVERVPRRQWRPDRPVRVGTVDGVDAELVGVMVDNFVHVELTAVQDARTDRLAQEHDDACERWTATAEEDRGEFPEEPAHRLMGVDVVVSDSLGTAYVPHGGRYGGSGTEWDTIQRFLPGPPAGVHQLEISLQTPNGVPVSISVPLT